MQNPTKSLFTLFRLFGIGVMAFAFAGASADFDAAAFKESSANQAKSYSTFTNGILSVQFDSTTAQFTVTTGSNHPHPGQQVLYPVGTSYITLRDATSSEMFANCYVYSPGLAGYTGVSMCGTPPQITSLGSTGFRATFTLANWTVVQEVKINGSTLADTNVSQAVTVTNTTQQTRRYGVRYMWDWMIAGNDASWFRQRNPDGNFSNVFANFDNPSFQLYEEVNNPESPTFSIYATVGGGTLIPSPTPPEQLRYSGWGNSYSSAWDFSNTGAGYDSATVYYWGYNAPLRLQGGRSATFVQYITTQLSAVTPTAAQVTLSSNALNFGDVAVGSSSTPQTVTVTSGGVVPYVIGSFDSTALCGAGGMCAGGGFVCSTTCSTAPTSYSSGASCQITASFAPIAPGPQSSAIYICDNATGSPHAITLNGNAVAGPQLEFSPSIRDFGSILVGSRSAAVEFAIVNPGSSPVPIGSIAATGEFVLISSTCGASLAPFDGCRANVLFAPTLPGRASGLLVVTSGSGSSSAALSGTGFHEARVQVASVVEFGAFTVGSPPLTQVVAVTNPGSAVLTFSSIDVTRPFTLTNACPLNLRPGETCNLLLGFGSNIAGDFAGTLTIVSNAAGGITTARLNAHAQLSLVPVVRVSPVSIGFGSRFIGTMGPAQRITVRNDGGIAATISAISASVDFPIVNRSCGSSLAPQAECFVDISFRPTATGSISGQLLVSTNAEGSPHAVGLRGTGCQPVAAGGNRLGTPRVCGP